MAQQPSAPESFRLSVYIKGGTLQRSSETAAAESIETWCRTEIVDAAGSAMNDLWWTNQKANSQVGGSFDVDCAAVQAEALRLGSLAAEAAAASDPKAKKGKDAKGKATESPPTPTTDENEYLGSSLVISVTADGNLERFCRGSRMLTVPAASMTSIPKPWLLGPAAEEGTDTKMDHEAALALCEDLSVNNHRYIIQLPLPLGEAEISALQAAAAAAAAATATGESGDGSGDALTEDIEVPAVATHQTYTLAAGRLVYAPVPKEQAAAETASELGAAEGEEEEEAEAEDIAAVTDYKWRIEWPEWSGWLSASSVAALQAQLESGETIRAEVFRVSVEPLPEGVSSLPDGERFELPGLMYMEEDCDGRGTLEIALDSLLLPDSVSAEAHTGVEPIVLTDEAKEAQAASDETAAAARTTALGLKPAKGGGKAKAKPKAAGKKDAKGGKGAPAESEEPPLPLYVQANTEVHIKVTVNQSLLVHPPTPPPPQLKPSDLIPPRPPVPKGPPGLAASAEFRRDVALAVNSIAEEYVSLCKEMGVLGQTQSGVGHRDDRRRQLLRSLNEGGLYQRIKDRLKKSAVRIVRERFHKTELSSDKDIQERDAFLSSLYTYLIGQANRAMNQAFAAAEAAMGGTLAPAALSQHDGSMQAGSTAVTGGVASLLAQTNKIAAGSVAVAPGSLSTLDDINPADVTGAAAAAADSALNTPGPDGEPQLQRLLRIAGECEFNGAFERAAVVLQDRVALVEKAASVGRAELDATVWYDYGAFMARRGDLTKAIECFREAVAIDEKHVPSLLALAAVQLEKQDTQQAAVFAASAIDSLVDGGATGVELLSVPLAHGEEGALGDAQVPLRRQTLAHTLHSVVLEYKGELVESGDAVKSAVRALREAGNEESWSAHAYLLLARYFLAMKLLTSAEKALSLAAAAMFDRAAPKWMRVELLVQEALQFVLRAGVSNVLAEVAGADVAPGDALRAVERLQEVTGIDSDCSEAWYLWAQVHHAQGEIDEARRCYELAVGSWDEAAQNRAVVGIDLLLRLATLYLGQAEASAPLDEELAGSAKEVFLRAARIQPWALAWSGAGQAATRLQDFGDAEACLSEANVRDNRNPVVWAWLCILCMTAPPVRETEAAQALDQALRVGLSAQKERDGAGLIAELVDVFAKVGKYTVSEGLCRRALRPPAAPRAKFHVELAAVLHEQAKDSEALSHLEQAVQLSDVSDETMTRVKELAKTVCAAAQVAVPAQLQ